VVLGPGLWDGAVGGAGTLGVVCELRRPTVSLNHFSEGLLNDCLVGRSVGREACYLEVAAFSRLAESSRLSTVCQSVFEKNASMYLVRSAGL
jgi:hypothetical protein